MCGHGKEGETGDSGEEPTAPNVAPGCARPRPCPFPLPFPLPFPRTTHHDGVGGVGGLDVGRGAVPPPRGREELAGRRGCRRCSGIERWREQQRRALSEQQRVLVVQRKHCRHGGGGAQRARARPRARRHTRRGCGNVNTACLCVCSPVVCHAAAPRQPAGARVPWLSVEVHGGKGAPPMHRTPSAALFASRR